MAKVDMSELERLPARVETIEYKLDGFIVSVGGRFDEVTDALVEQRQHTEFAFARLEERMNARFDKVDGRLEGMEKRLDGLEQRLDGLERRFDGLEQRFNGIEVRMDRLEARFDRLEGRFDRMENKLDLLISRKPRKRKRR